MWKKEGWTQETPLTAESFAESTMDFCSKHSLNAPPRTSPKNASSAPMVNIASGSEDEQLQQALAASLQRPAAPSAMEEEDDEEVEVVDPEDIAKPPAEEKMEPVSEFLPLLDIAVEDEPASGSRIQIRMPDGKRSVRKFDPSAEVTQIYAFVAVRVCFLSAFIISLVHLISSFYTQFSKQTQKVSVVASSLP